MVLNSYIISFKRIDGNVVFHFDAETGRLAKVEFNAELNDDQYRWWGHYLPFDIDGLRKLVKSTEGITLEAMQADLSFANFWQQYKYKVGNKKRSERLWNSLSKANKGKAINFIPKYEAQLLQTNHDKLYPETYLNQQRWNN